MKRRYFGTDGVRGTYGGDLMNLDFARRLGRAAGLFLRCRGEKAAVSDAAMQRTARGVVLGRDTRLSGPELEGALVAGLLETGTDVVRLGVAPTPAVSLAVPRYEAGLGAAITASHNPAEDNGIKFFSGLGNKLTEDEELEIEGYLQEGETAALAGAPGTVRDACSLAFYEEKVAGVLPSGALAGWKIVLDTANGAGFGTAASVLERLGAALTRIGETSDGRNINAGVGSEHPEKMATLVKDAGASLGIALDGDGDRVVLADETGSLLSGDEVLAILARSALERNALAGSTLVATEQSNLGLDEAVMRAGGRVVRTDIGDRHVAERMRAGGYNLGGESSGHVIFSDVSFSGDGLLAALKMIEVMRFAGKPLSGLRRDFEAWPQLSANVKVREKRPIESLVHLSQTIREAGASLGGEGRVLVRYSGTEPKIRLLVEGKDRKEAARWLEKLTGAVASDGIAAE